MSDHFFVLYDKWKKDALREFKNSEYWCDDYKQGTLEIMENGDVYLGNLAWIKNAVTPWVDSEQFKRSKEC